MKILLEDRQYLDIKISKDDSKVTLTMKTQWEENSFALSSLELDSSQLDRLISELINLKTKVKNAKV
jgi:hypothetical protein